MVIPRKNLTIFQGKTFERFFVMKDVDNEPIDLTGYTFRGQIRRTYSTAGNPIASFTFAVQGDPEDGIVKVSLTASETAAIMADDAIGPNKVETRFCYDIECVPPDTSVFLLVEGLVLFWPEVTK